MNQQDKWFVQWETETFGAGYGTGEMPILSSIKVFFNLIDDNMYNHQKISSVLGETVCWFIINALNKSNNIEWGTSARYGWLTSSGKLLKAYFDTKSNQELYDICMSNDGGCMCYGEIKDHPNCTPNPFINEKYANKIIYEKKN